MGIGNYLPPNDELMHHCYYIDKSTETWEEHQAEYGNEYYSDADDFYHETSRQAYEDILDGFRYSTFLNTAPNGMTWKYRWDYPECNTWRDSRTVVLAEFEYNELMLCDYEGYYAVTIMTIVDAYPEDASNYRKKLWSGRMMREQDELQKLLLLHLAENYPNSVYVRDTAWTSKRVNLEGYVKLAEIRRKEMDRIAKRIEKDAP